MKKPRLLVTGGAGYIGSSFLGLFSNHFDSVVCIDNLNSGNVNQLPVSTIFERVDIRDSSRVKQIVSFHKPDVVLHLAGLASPFDSVEESTLYSDVNVGGTISLLKAVEHISKYHRCSIVYASSCSVYGSNTSCDCIESDVNPISPYATTKHQAERLIDQNPQIISYCLRFFNVVGSILDLGIGDVRLSPESPGRLVPNILKASYDPKRYSCSLFTGNGPSPSRSYVHVFDLCACVLTAVELTLHWKKQATNASVFKFDKYMKGICDIATVNATVDDVVEICQEVTQHELASKVDRSPRRECDPLNANAAITLNNFNDVLSPVDPRRHVLCRPKFPTMRSMIESSWKLMRHCDASIVPRGCSTLVRKMSPIMVPWRPGVPIPSLRSSCGSLVLLVRHGPRRGGPFPSTSVPLSPEGVEYTRRCGELVKDVSWASRALYSIPRCRETAELLLAPSSRTVQLCISQLLGYHGPFVADPDICRPLVEKSISNNCTEFLKDIIRGNDVTGHHPRDFGVRRLFSELSMFSEPGRVLLAVSHDSVIAAVMEEFGIPSVEQWPDPLTGILCDATMFGLNYPLIERPVIAPKPQISDNLFGNLLPKFPSKFSINPKSPFLDQKLRNAASVARDYNSRGFHAMNTTLPIRATLQTTCRNSMSATLLHNICSILFPTLLQVQTSTIDEPFLWEQFPTLLRKCEEYSVGLDVTTNALHCSEVNVELLSKVCIDCKISVDKSDFINHANPEDHLSPMTSFSDGKKDCIKSLLSAFEKGADIEERFMTKPATVSLLLVVTDITYHLLPLVVELAIEIGVKSVIARHYVVLDDDRDEGNKSLLNNDVLLGKFEYIKNQCCVVAKQHPELTLSLPETPCSSSWPSMGYVKCSQPFSSIVVDSDGSVFPCMSHSGNSMGVLDEFSDREYFLDHVWNNDFSKSLRQCLTAEMVNQTMCDRCGGCIEKMNDMECVMYNCGGAVELPYLWSKRIQNFDTVGTVHQYNNAKYSERRRSSLVIDKSGMMFSEN